MKVAVIGGGPAGLYFALLLKKARPETAITVVERNRPDDTFGWGVVFSDQTLENFRAADPETCDRIESSFAHWDDIDVHIHGPGDHLERTRFRGIARRKLLQILQERAAGLGVTLRVSDGGRRRARPASARPRRPRPDRRRRRREQQRSVRGTPRISSPTSTCGRLDTSGWARRFRSRPSRSTSSRTNTACSRRTAIASMRTPRRSSSSATSGRGGTRASIDSISTRPSRRASRCSGRWLGGHRLMSNARHLSAPWSTFVRVRNEAWFHEQPRPHRRRRAHRALLDRIRHEAGDGGRDRARP